MRKTPPKIPEGSPQEAAYLREMAAAMQSILPQATLLKLLLKKTVFFLEAKNIQLSAQCISSTPPSFWKRFWRKLLLRPRPSPQQQEAELHEKWVHFAFQSLGSLVGFLEYLTDYKPLPQNAPLSAFQSLAAFDTSFPPPAPGLLENTPPASPPGKKWEPLFFAAQQRLANLALHMESRLIEAQQNFRKQCYYAAKQKEVLQLSHHIKRSAQTLRWQYAPTPESLQPWEAQNQQLQQLQIELAALQPRPQETQPGQPFHIQKLPSPTELQSLVDIFEDILQNLPPLPSRARRNFEILQRQLFVVLEPVVDATHRKALLAFSIPAALKLFSPRPHTPEGNFHGS